MLAALAEEPARGLTRHDIRVFAGYVDSGPVSKALAGLVANGWATPTDRGLTITAKGIDELGDYPTLPRGSELYNELMAGSRLMSTEKKLLARLVSHRSMHRSMPTMTRKELREAVGYADSGPVSKAMARLVTFGYAVDEGRAGLRAADRLFDGGS